jgi:polyferredoxin
MEFTGRSWVRTIVKHPLFPGLAQGAALVVFGGLILLGWNFHAIRGIDVPDPLVYTNINTLFFWVIWLMGLILLVPLVGRLWCTICPLGLVNELATRVGAQLRWPARLRNFWPAALLLVFYNVLVAVYRINHYPDYSSRLLLGVLLMVVAVGLLFKGRIFCGYLCPMGAMVGVYSRVSPWRLEVRSREVCRACQTKDCYLGVTRGFSLTTPLFRFSFPFRRPGCQVDLFPPELVEDPRCVMCTQCIKNCPVDNIRWGSRPFLGGVASRAVPRASEAVFILFLAGATMGIFTRVWPGLNSLITTPGVWAASLIPGLPRGMTAGIAFFWSFGLVTLAGGGLLALLAHLLGSSRLARLPDPLPEDFRASFSFGLTQREEDRVREAEGWGAVRRRPGGIFSAFTLAFVPLILGAHAAFALIKVNEKLLYLPGALRDPTGVKLYLAIHKLGMMAVPREVVPLAAIRWISLALVAVGAAASLVSVGRIARLHYGDDPPLARWGTAVYGGAVLCLGTLWVVLVVKWLF